MKTLSDVFQDYLSRRLDLSDATIEQYKMCLNQFSEWAGRDVTIEELSTESILAFMRHRKSLGRCNRTVNNVRAMLITLWKHAFRKKFTTRIPPDSYDLPKLKVVKTVPEAWSLAELNKLLHACDNTRPLPYWDHRHWRALILVLWDTAHRLDSVLSAQVSDIQNEHLTVRKTKQNWEVVHKLHLDTLAALSRLPEHESGLIFPWPFKRRQIWREFKQILRAANLPCGRRDLFHKLRRTSATHLAAVAGIEAAENHLGHSTHGLARSTYVDPRFMPSVKAADVLPKLGGEVTP